MPGPAADAASRKSPFSPRTDDGSEEESSPSPRVKLVKDKRRDDTAATRSSGRGEGREEKRSRSPEKRRRHRRHRRRRDETRRRGEKRTRSPKKEPATRRSSEPLVAPPEDPQPPPCADRTKIPCPHCWQPCTKEESGRRQHQWLNLLCLTWQHYSDMGAKKNQKGAWELAKAKAMETRQKRLFYGAPAPRSESAEPTPKLAKVKEEEFEDVPVEEEPVTPKRRPASGSGKKAVAGSASQAARAALPPAATPLPAAATAPVVPAPVPPAATPPATQDESAAPVRQMIINIGR